MWNAEQLAGFLTHVADDRLRPPRPLATTGLRRDEALSLPSPDLTSSPARSTLPGLNTGLRRPRTERAQDRPRPSHFCPRSSDARDSQGRCPREAHERSASEEAWVETYFVFTRQNDQPLHPWHVSKAFKDRLKAAATAGKHIAWLAPQLRYLRTVQGVNQRVVVRAGLGHLDSRPLTLNMYSHVLTPAGSGRRRGHRRILLPPSPLER